MSTSLVVQNFVQPVAYPALQPGEDAEARAQIIMQREKPARKQVKPGQVEKSIPEQSGKEYNIWYNKWAGGDREDNYSNKTKSQTRCHIKRDSGWTRGDITGQRYLCLFFSRGCCPYGYECAYLHRLPSEDTSIPDPSLDCFARNKFADYRDDMGGVGSFNRQNRTLYIGRIKETGPGTETEEIVIRHFKEWGQIEKVRVLQHRSVAFVTYVSEFNAQFAKEAMACQSLDNDEILNVRWATEDPNPTSKVLEIQRLEDIGQRAIAEKMDDRVVEAVRAVKMLEDASRPEGEPEEAENEELKYLLPEEILADEMQADMNRREAEKRTADELDEEDEDEPPAKRAKTVSSAPTVPSQAPPQAVSTTKAVPETRPPEPPVLPAAKGLLSAETMQGLKYFAEIRARQQAEAGSSKPAAAPAKPGLGLGLEYGSDDDDDE
ncbi:hypothetical protein DACRYDRAFT_104844 [Dacryopinax primogenitus]|uniref:Pre-mRNA-splicing factor CWC2 n=1 Tax=Dacryopinax primogenitus (strain DJM 731) TaxID=1858805 RepID=M5G9K6_DACPD|nr:uncharacterized protein DACRYDRAFT_104844 [Dacryopinax primogenitus]EJU04950.1 hypothetical protein DACRYDRAFT_104844 [Dacryopinax primogenitus]